MKTPQSEIIIYKTKDGKNSVEVKFKAETLWLNLQQIADLFDRDKSVVSRHLSNIFKEGELLRKSVVAKNATTAADGKTYQVEYFNLDAIISVGYRVNSKQGTKFRQWATSVLKDHLTKGWTLSKQRFEQNAKELETALELVQNVVKNQDGISDLSQGVIDVIASYTKTFLLLQRYDEGLLGEPKTEGGGKLSTVKEIRKSLAKLKADLIVKKEATVLFAQERGDALEAILGNLEQTIFSNPAYPSIESKAAHLLYFVIKNHPFTDGNKRSAAFLFIDFLNSNHRLFDKDNQVVINDIGLAALTLLVAESNPKNKDIMIKLIMNMLIIKKHD